MNYQSEIREVQLIALEILKEVVRICDKHKIEYFLDSGTALGAVRHQGFIPWDDDVDIGMTRDNYDRFLKVASQELRDCFFLQTNATEKRAPFIYTKIRKNGTAFTEWCLRNIEMHQGIYIDIFPYDHVPDEEKERKLYHKTCRFLYKVFLMKTIPDINSQPQRTLKWLVMAIFRRVLYYLLKLVPLSLISKMTDKLLRKYNKVKTKCLTCHMFSKTYIFDKNVLFPLKRIKFEEDFFTIVNDVEKYLTVLYGDYKRLPPVEQRQGHRPYILKY